MTGKMKILVFGPNWVGDSIMARPMIASLKKALPGSRLTLAVRPSVCSLWQGDDFIDEIVVLPPISVFRGPIVWLDIIRAIKNRHFDLTIILPHFFVYALIAVLAGIKTRLGYAVCRRGNLLTKPLPYLPSLRSEHMVENYFRLLRSAGLEPEVKALELKIGSEELERARGWLKKVDVQDKDLIVGVGPGAIYGKAKRWPEKRYAWLADKLIDQLGVKVIIFAGPRERDAAGRMKKYMRNKPLLPEFPNNLKEVAALIKRCDLFVGNDSGLGHIAAAVKTKVITLFGSTSPAWTKPCTEKSWVIYKAVECSPCFKRKCCFGTYRCLNLIKGEEVFVLAQRLLKEGAVETDGTGVK